MDMTSRSSATWSSNIWRSVAELPPLKEYGRSKGARVVTRETRRSSQYDYDPHPKYGQSQQRDFIAEPYLRSAFKACGLDMQTINATLATRTRSNFIDEKSRSLDHALDVEAVLGFSPPDVITREVITSVVNELVDEFDIRDLFPEDFLT